MQPTWALTIVPSLRSECTASERKCSIQIPFPDLDLITKVTFFFWILPMCHSAASDLTIFLTWIDPLDIWSLTLPSYSGLPSGLCALSLWLGQESAPSQIFCPTTILPQPRVHWNEMYIVPHITKEFLITIRLQCLWYLCDHLFWLSIFEKVLQWNSEDGFV